jgi:methylamine---glutamate N-methyltransferase subunit B
MNTFDLTKQTVRALNQALHDLPSAGESPDFEVLEPRGAHALACGIKSRVRVHVRGHAGYYCAGMHQHGEVLVHGNTGVGVAENMMSGLVRVHGHASQSAGATAHGGLLVIEGDASARCGISLKGADIVVQGSIGHMSAFMAQAGRIVVCGDAGEALGDSIYEAQLFVRGKVASLGADCIEQPMEPEHLAELTGLLAKAEIPVRAEEFRRYGSARTLYHFKIDNASVY